MEYGFVAYIDESGDDGLKRVRPIHPNGSSEWFVLSAVVVQTANEKAVGRWQREMRGLLKNTQRRDIHYRDLIPAKKAVVCDALASHPQRSFVVMSNKKNIVGYSNARCYQEKNYLYWWVTRLLLERVTAFCAKRSKTLYGKALPIKLVFSQRGGMAYDRLVAYLNLLRFQSEGEVGPYNQIGLINWSVIDLDQVHVRNHGDEAGLQLADVVAGAFYQAVCTDGRACNPAFAEKLVPRLYRGPKGRLIGFGLKPIPTIPAMHLTAAQMALFNSVKAEEVAVGARTP